VVVFLNAGHCTCTKSGGYSVEMRLDILLASFEAFACETLVASRALAPLLLSTSGWSEALLGRF